MPAGAGIRREHPVVEKNVMPQRESLSLQGSGEWRQLRLVLRLEGVNGNEKPLGVRVPFQMVSEEGEPDCCFAR